MNVTALIIVHERPAHLRGSLRALTFQTCPAAQIVVVDDGSAPALHDYLFFLDCDIAVFPDVIERHIAASRAGTFLINDAFQES